MTLENKIKKGIVIAAGCLALVGGGYFGNYSYHTISGSICDKNIHRAEQKVALNKKNAEDMLLMKEVCEDLIKFSQEEFGYASNSSSTLHYIDGLVKYFEEQVKDTNKQIEELTQKREIHQKRKINPFYKVFSK